MSRFFLPPEKRPSASTAPPASEARSLPAPSSVHRVLSTPGERLSAAQQQRYQPALGGSLADVRVHRGAEAEASADAVDANAYTVGSQIVLGRVADEDVLAHELAHVAQQRGARGGPPGTSIPIAASGTSFEHEAEHFARGGAATSFSPAPLQLSRDERKKKKEKAKEKPKPKQARLTIVDLDSGLTDGELKKIEAHARKALGKTTKKSKDADVSAGVIISHQRGLAGVRELVKRGDLIVFVIGKKKDAKSIPDEDMKTIVHDIIDAEGLITDAKRSEELNKRLLGDMKEELDEEGNVKAGRSEHDPATQVSIVNVDYIPKRDRAGLRAIAGDVLHEGVGHRAGLGHSESGVMTEAIRENATDRDIVFSDDESTQVNEFLKKIIDDPTLLQ